MIMLIMLANITKNVTNLERREKLTSTSPVSFSLSINIKFSRSGPANSLKYSGQSDNGNFWKKSDKTRKQHISTTYFSSIIHKVYVIFIWTLTLAVSTGLAVEGKLAWVILHHELLKQALNDLTDRGGTADV